MVLISAVVPRKSPLLFRFLGHCIKPSSRAIVAPKFLHLTSPTGTPSRSCSSYTVFRSSAVSSKELCGSGNGLRRSGFDCFRVAGIAGGGSGGAGGNGNDGSDSGSSGGNNGGDGGGDNWSPLSWYLALLEKYPVWTKALTSALLTFIGDLICQLYIDQAPSLDLKRITLFTFLGLVLVGPTLHFWYLYLSKMVTMSGASGAFLRLVIDQFLFAPAFIGVFLSTVVTLEGSPSQVKPKLQQEWFSTVLANWRLWIPFQFLNFRFVPQQFQVLAANFIAVVWNVIISYKAHKKVETNV